MGVEYARRERYPRCWATTNAWGSITYKGQSYMCWKWPVATFLLFVGLLAFAQNKPQSLGSSGIVGTVLNEEGQLVDHAKACVSFTSGNSRNINCNVSTDKDGQFTIEGLKIGKYGVFAINETEGYSIDNQSPGQEVRITADEPWPNVTVRLRPRGGILVGSVSDKTTGKAVKGAWVQYILIDNGGGSRYTDGEFQMAVPADSDLLVLVWAKGYKGWLYNDASSPTRPVLRLASGERKVLEVELEPLPKTSTQP
jgi:Carboxypeptidase regulatory-like domain